MWVPQASVVVLLVLASIHTACSEKGSLVYVIDTTGSMADDIAQVKQSSKAITKTVFEEKASQIKNMMIVTFNDPDARLDTITEDRMIYEWTLNQLSIIEYSGGDCPEMSLKGLSIALEESLPESYIYLFTDASAKDHYKKDYIIKMCQQKKSQIVFVLSGRCDEDYWLPPFQVYYEIAAACAGLAINIEKNEVHKIFKPIKDAIKDSNEVVTSKSIPKNARENVEFVITDQTEYATVTVAGDHAQLKIFGPSAVKEMSTWLENFKVMKLINPAPGTYTADVWSASVTTIKIVAKSDFSFLHGFSELQPKTLKDTIAQPHAESSTHLLVSVTDPRHTVKILSAQILDINENILVDNMPLKQISGNLYSTPYFKVPSKIFKVAVTGSAINTGKSIRHMGRFPITPQPAKKPPRVSGEASKTVRVGTSTKLICKITQGLPEPTISWQFKAESKSEYAQSVGSGNELIISSASEEDAGQYKCVAHNDVGDAEHVTALIVEFRPYITSDRSATYEGIEGDVALKIPCEHHGVPTPVISWLGNHTAIKTGPRYSILPDGALIIKDPKKKDTGSYTCVVTNPLGSVRATFEAKVTEKLEHYGPTKEVFIDITKQNTYRMECGSPGQYVKWFMENLGEANVSGNYYELNNLKDIFESNYTCRVSDKNGGYTKTFVVVGSKPPKFHYEKEGDFDWSGSDEDFLDCTLEHEDFTDVEWTYNGKKLSDQKTLTLNVDRKWGTYTCKVRNHFGAVERSFNVMSTQCIISRNPEKYEAMPLILDEKSSWARLKSNEEYFKIEPGTKLRFACPKNEAIKNNFKIFPTSNEITVICDKQDIFIVKGKPYKLSDLECDHPVIPSVIKEKKQCAEGPTENLLVGYSISTTNFLQTYQVCFDKSKKIPIYSLESMPNSNNDRDVEYSWYKHPAVDFRPSDSLYTCEKSTSICCYNKTQLISNRAFSDSVAQTSTFIDPLNAVPFWIPCDEYQSPWNIVETKIRKKLSRSPVSAVWSGIHMRESQNRFDAPRYLFKLVEFREGKPIAIVFVNGPSPTNEDVLCENTFGDDEVSWLRGLGDHVYLCDGEDFRKAFKFNHYK